jgi:signal transduction histidine kinase
MVLTACVGAVVLARLLLWLASPADYLSQELFSGALYASPLAAPLLTSPFDFLVSALGAASLVLIGMGSVERVRTRRVLRRVDPTTSLGRLAVVAVHSMAGGLLLAIVVLHRSLIQDTVANTAADLLQFSLHPWNPARLALQVGLVVWHVAAIGTGVVVLRMAMLPWRRRGRLHVLLSLACWAAPFLIWAVFRMDVVPSWTVDLPRLAASIMVALGATRVMARYRQGSQAFRLLLVALLLTVPALAAYPATFSLVAASKRDAVETRYAPQAINQRQTVQRLMQESLAQIDALPGLEALVADSMAADDTAAAQRAFEVWRATGLASYPITSSVELFGADGRLASRFAFNLPDDLTATLRDDEEGCAWTIYEEVSPFFAEERRVLHAGRTLCVPDAAGTTVVGTIVVHATLDYGNLPFIGSQSPYVALLQFGDALQDESLSGSDLEYSVYGWSGRPAYASSGTAWPLPSDVLAAVGSSREPRWATLTRDDQRYSVYLQNDRGGIYALGFPMLSAIGHLVNLAELVVLAGVAGLLLLVFAIALDLARGQPSSGRALLQEIRASFYRKLFLAFVAAAVIPVVTLAVLTRNYIADQLRANVEEEAVRTVSAARRVVEDLVVPRSTATSQVVDDNLLVWVSRLIDEDVNVFRGTRLQATSERNLFASGVLATRTPAGVYRALTLRRDATSIITDRIGTFAYLVAATPLTTRLFEGMLTVPLTLRQQDIERQIDTLNRLVLLGAMLFILAGAGLGYSLAERIADPVSRLTRATRRIARGELDVRIAATSSDELQRLVQDFNRMAEDLQRQRAELERTHRLEAWAEMARQVAHEIKNPLTPIQLNAEHLRRVHADRGAPLSPMLEDCVANILTQVGLLRTIASEFSNFASSPVVRRESIALADLLRATLTPYEGALAGRIRIALHVPSGLPHVVVDKTLLARAVTNVIENAVHAMPATGHLQIEATAADAVVRLAVTDSGPGMDEAALARAFEPYFSTKVTGTGLGLPIARRNVELCGGTIDIASTRGVGTTVTMHLPTA